jgi:hypothetical protein
MTPIPQESSHKDRMTMLLGFNGMDDVGSGDG